jgi:RNA polymerase sigma-70 factor (ECF subfamily)
MSQGILTKRDFEKLYNEKYMQLYYLAYDYVSDMETSRDIVSDVFAKVWKARERLDTDMLHSYLFVSVRNACIDYLKKRSQRSAFEKEFACRLEDFVVDDWEARDDRIRQIQDELKKMPERTQIVLKERFYNDRSNQDVAEQLGISEAGIKKMITRAFCQLRGKLK